MKKRKAVLFSSPCNPSGGYYTYDELKSLAKVIAKYPHVTVISDEIYEYINYETKTTSIARFPEIYEQTAVINGMSKAFAMTGWRIGYSACPEWLAKACEKSTGTNDERSKYCCAKSFYCCFKNRSFGIQIYD